MASSVAGVMGWGVSDGEMIDAPSTRWSTASRVDISGGASPTAVRGGIVPAGGDPLGVVAFGTPGKGVTLKAGTVIIPGNSTGVPPLALTLTANTSLDVADGHPTLPRIDLVIARINSTGSSSSIGVFEVIQGTPNASPSRPAVPNTGADHSIVLKTINVPAGNTAVINAQLSSAAATDAGYMAAPGGTVQVASRSNVLSGAVAPHDYQPFFSMADRLPGFVLPGTGPALWGMQSRVFSGLATPNTNGDIVCEFGLYLDGAGFTKVPFPNAFFCAFATDSTQPEYYTGPVIYKQLSQFCTTSAAVFRCYTAGGTVMAAPSFGAIQVNIVAFGR